MTATHSARAPLQHRLNHFVPRATADTGLRHAAVALVVVLLEGADEPGIIMTRRASRLRDHPGQFAFPGGRLDPGENAFRAALRELHEEVGLALDASSRMGTLDDYVTRSGYVMTPVVLWGGELARGVLKPNEAEVESVFVVPLSQVDAEPSTYAIPESSRPVINVPFLDTVLHAPSGAIMHQFREIALHGRVTRVDHYEQPLFAWGPKKSL